MDECRAHQLNTPLNQGCGVILSAPSSEESATVYPDQHRKLSTGRKTRGPENVYGETIFGHAGQVVHILLKAGYQIRARRVEEIGGTMRGWD